MELIHAINEWAAAIGMRQVEADETGGFTLLFDGVHDILAWRPIGGKAPWMELGFRKFTAKFSRLRIYGANLKAPEFSILKYGKWNILQPAEIKQDKYWLELDFGKTFSTVKCRIDWKKWTRGLELYEIELIP